MKIKFKHIIIAAVVLWFGILVWSKNTTIPVGKNAVVIPGECIVINYDATPEEFDAAKAAWLKALGEYPRKNTGHTKVYY